MRVRFAAAIVVFGCGGSQPGLTTTPLATSINASACEGPALDLLAAIASPTCRITEDEADALRNVLEDPAKTPLRVEAVLLEGDRVEVRIVNTGRTKATLPLFVHSAVDRFITRANGKHLAAPEPEWPSRFSFAVGRMLSKIVLPPNGVASAKVRITPKLVTEDLGDCPPNAKCAPELHESALARGPYELAIETPLYAARTDLVAKLAWTNR